MWAETSNYREVEFTTWEAAIEFDYKNDIVICHHILADGRLQSDVVRKIDYQQGHVFGFVGTRFHYDVNPIGFTIVEDALASACQSLNISFDKNGKVIQEGKAK